MEPHLQPVTDEQFILASSNTEGGARLDISANGFWGGRCEKTYIDVKVFNPHAPSNQTTNAKSIYREHELSKKRLYEARIREVEHSSFTPLIFSATGGMANKATFTSALPPCYLTSGTQIMQLPVLLISEVCNQMFKGI